MMDAQTSDDRTKRLQAALTDRIRKHALEMGFDSVGFSPAVLPPDTHAKLQAFTEAGKHGEMSWLAERMEERAQPQKLWPEVRTVISLGVSYAPGDDPLATLARRECGNISVYARNRDYHDLIKGMLKHLAQFVIAEARRRKVDAGVKVFVDTAPVSEKPLAEQAGLGWQGKHTNLVSRQHGSWMFLGEVFTTLDLIPSVPSGGSCGSCTRCLVACPTDAFPSAWQMDARRCISYLTIEHSGPIPLHLRKAMGNRIYGCDDCLAVCPWNRFAAASRHMKLTARDDLKAPPLTDLLSLDDAGFRNLFSGSPIKRIGRNRFVRNTLIAAGNSENRDLIDPVTKLRSDRDPVVAETAEWATQQLLQK